MGGKCLDTVHGRSPLFIQEWVAEHPPVLGGMVFDPQTEQNTKIALLLDRNCTEVRRESISKLSSLTQTRGFA